MKILISAQSYPTPKVQLAAFMAVLAEEMTRQGVELTVIAPQSLTMCIKHKIPLTPQQSIVMVETKSGEKKLTILRPWSLTLGQGRFFNLSQRIDRWVVNRTARRLKEKPDVVYSHFWWSVENILDYAKVNHLPSFVATGEDEIDIHRHLSKGRIEEIAKGTKGVICVSSKNRDESIEAGLTEAAKCIVLPNAIDEKVFRKMDKREARKQLGYNNNDFIVAYCGRFNERKGCKRVSQAIMQIGDKRVKSIFIGSQAGGELEDPSCDGILYKGRLPHNDIPLYLNAADVFVLPTLGEGCSNSIVEAMACGLPIISSDLPFNYDILNGDNSIMIDPLNVQQVAEAIVKLKNDDALRERMGRASLAKASELTISRRVGRIIEFIKDSV